MLEPVGHKTEHFMVNGTDPVLCPLETFPYIATNLNSKDLRRHRQAEEAQKLIDLAIQAAMEMARKFEL